MKVKSEHWYLRQRIKRLRIDNFECAICHSRNKLHVHHIDGNGTTSESQNNAIENLITLCVRCHRKAHARHGWRYDATKELYANGYTALQISKLLGVTRSRIYKILQNICAN